MTRLDKIIYYCQIYAIFLIMKKILCFGDSNTYGFNPKDGSRYNINTRWAGRLKNDCEVTEAGCNNRTAFSDNPAGDNFTGYKILPEYLKQHFDYIIVQIGINDLQKTYNVNLTDFEKGMKEFFNIIKYYSPSSKVIILAPCVIRGNILDSYFKLFFNENSIEKSKLILPVYKKIAEQNNYSLINLNEITTVSDIDGLHYEPEQHEIIYNTVKNLINI